MAERIHANTRSVAEIMTNVAMLLPEIRERAAEIEAGRRVPPDLVEKLRAAGCFRMAVPRAFGGAECSKVELFELYEALAAADASAAWIVMIGGPTPNYLAPFPEETFRGIYASGPDVIMGAALSPARGARAVPGGYIVDGRWKWGSGSAHADWFMCNCFVMEGEALAAGAAPGMPLMRSMLIAPKDVDLVDTWRVSGLRGTGSGDIVVKDLFVPDHMSADPFGAPNTLAKPFRKGGAAAGPYVAAVALGIARGALDDLVALALADRRRLGATRRLADDGVFQNRLGETEATLRAARAAFYNQILTLEDQAHGLPDGPALNAHPLIQATNATAVWATKAAASVVDAAYNAGAGSSVWDDCPLQRRFRNVHTATQHISVADSILTRHGAALVGGKAA